MNSLPWQGLWGYRDLGGPVPGVRSCHRRRLRVCRGLGPGEEGAVYWVGQKDRALGKEGMGRGGGGGVEDAG